MNSLADLKFLFLVPMALGVAFMIWALVQLTRQIRR